MKMRAYLGFLFASKRSIATQCVRSIFDLAPAALRQEGVRALLLDIDDTIAGHKDTIPPETISWLSSAAEHLTIALVSNCGPARRAAVADVLGAQVAAINSGPDKPAREAFTEVLNALGIRGDEAAMVGDRLSMDLYGATLAGISKRILVEPFSAVHGGQQAPLAYRLIRQLENGRP